MPPFDYRSGDGQRSATGSRPGVNTFVRMNRTVSTTVNIAMAAGGLALLGACSGAPAPIGPAASSSPASPSSSPSAPLVNVGGLALRYPDGFTLYRSADSYAQVIKRGGGDGGANLFAMDTVVDPKDGYVPAPADALAWLRAQKNFTVEDLGKIRVSGQDVPVARVTSNTGDPIACGPKAATSGADGTCFLTGTPGPVYGFVRVGDRTIVVERGSLSELEDWAPLLSLENQ